MAETAYSQLRDFSRPSLAPLLPLPLPFSMFIEPTNNCNFRCRFCPESFADYNEIVGGRGHMDFALFEQVVAQIKAMGRLKVLRFYMLGEPLLNPDLIRMITLANDAGIADRTELTTNGTALTAEKSHGLIASGLTYLRVSIYAATQAHSEFITQSKISVQRIQDNVRLFRELRDAAGAERPHLYVKMIDTGIEEENAAFLAAFKPIADECDLEKPMNWNGYENRNVLDSVYTDSDQKKRIADSRLFPFQKKICPFPFYTMVVNANGDVTACCVDWNKNTKVGNVREATLHDIWHGEGFRNLRRLHIEGRRRENASCANCTYLFTSPDNLDGLSTEEYERILS